MVPAFLVLLACELAGDVLHQMLGLPVPGPVIGMAILAGVLTFNKTGAASKSSVTDSLERTAETLIHHMGLLFVPAGVGLIAEVEVLRSEWLPIAAGLIGSTVLSLTVTGLVMHWGIRRRAARHSPEAVRAIESS